MVPLYLFNYLSTVSYISKTSFLLFTSSHRKIKLHKECVLNVGGNIEAHFQLYLSLFTETYQKCIVYSQSNRHIPDIKTFVCGMQCPITRYIHFTLYSTNIYARLNFLYPFHRQLKRGDVKCSYINMLCKLTVIVGCLEPASVFEYSNIFKVKFRSIFWCCFSSWCLPLVVLFVMIEVHRKIHTTNLTYPVLM